MDDLFYRNRKFRARCFRLGDVFEKEQSPKTYPLIGSITGGEFISSKKDQFFIEAKKVAREECLKALQEKQGCSFSKACFEIENIDYFIDNPRPTKNDPLAMRPSVVYWKHDKDTTGDVRFV